MAKIGPFVTDPKAGAYCRVTLDSGEKVVVNHDKGGFKGGLLTVELLKFMGFSSERFFECNLDSDQGRTLLVYLTRKVREAGIAATPLGAFVEFVKACPSVAEVKRGLAALQAAR